MSDVDRQATSSEDDGSRDARRLGLIVEQEARRVLSEAQLEADPALVAAGWERRFIGDARQVKEAVELYSHLGYEVHTEPVKVEEMDDDCEGCQVVVLLQFQTIYTRKKRD
jgi:hypothetical protein